MYAHPANICVQLAKEKWVVVNPVHKTVDILDEEVVQYLSQVKSAKRPDENTLEALYSQGFLTEEPISLADIYGRFEPPRRSSRVNFAIACTYDCNLQCTYCFQKADSGTLDAKSDTATLDTQKIEMLLDAIGELKRELLVLSLDQLSFEITGGEPLLPSNRSVVEQLLDGLGNRSPVLITTNGTHVSEFVDLLSSHYVYLKITLDGIPSVHDKRKRTITKEGTYDSIVKGIRRARDEDILVTVKVNVDRHNFRDLHRLVDRFRSYGWLEDEKIRFGLARVRPTSLYPSGWTPAEFVENMCSYLEKHGLQRLFRVTFKGEEFFEEIFSGREPETDIYRCKIDKIFFFSPDGSFCPCIHMTQYPTGTFFPKFSMSRERINILKSRTIKSMPKCMQCSYALICGGGCPAESLKEHESLFNPMCLDYPRILRAYIPYILQNRFKIRW
ncbi:MAG: radical SAM protein [Theionarchaea archaeon]|nr:MAG: hypothetical protein AYK19_01045 [Theionarchaea archaeon DG-70-1]MBU7029949.1 radical SAM protein [Theionarchaea archaeon]